MTVAPGRTDDFDGEESGQSGGGFQRMAPRLAGTGRRIHVLAPVHPWAPGRASLRTWFSDSDAVRNTRLALDKARR